MTEPKQKGSEADRLEERFSALVEELRPELHRYCARMTGSAMDGEDVVQEALAQAYSSLSTLKEVESLRGWLFRIAHNKAIDFLRRYDVRYGEPLRDGHEGAEHPDDTVVRQETARRALSTFVRALPPRERACVILKDVLNHSLAEIGATLDMTVLAVKSALHRGRSKLRQTADAPLEPEPEGSPTADVLSRYVALFNARDWDGVRGLLAEDVRLDLVSVAQRRGKEAVGRYFHNYDRLEGWRLALHRVDGILAVVLYEKRDDGLSPRSLIRLRTETGRITRITDYRQVTYLLQDLDVPDV